MQYMESKKRIDPSSLFKPSVAQITVVLPLRQGIQFDQFSEDLVGSISRGNLELEEDQRISSYVSGEPEIAKLKSTFRHAELNQYVTSNPLRLLLPIFARSFKPLQVKFDVYGAVAVYVQLDASAEWSELDLDEIRAERFNEKLQMKRDWRYLVAQAVLESGLFEKALVAKGKWDCAEN